MASYVMNLAKRRKTVRRFSSTPISMEDILAALEIACEAPSGANSQPWRFLIVTDPQIKRKIREACERTERKFYSEVKGEVGEWLLTRGFTWEKPFLEEAPIIVLVLSVTKAPYATQSVWLAVGYILLALEELGLGTVTYTPSTTREVQDEVSIPDEFRVEAILPVGVSADEKSKEPRFRLNEVTYPNQWGHTLKRNDSDQSSSSM